MRRNAVACAAVIVALLSACGGGREASYSPAPSPGSALVVERFLQAANANDLTTMIQLFGTAQQTIDQLDGRSKAERRMYVLASLLRHDDYAIRGQRPVPGRIGEAIELQVQLLKSDQSVLVPFTLVEKDAGGWIIEKIDIEPLTQTG
jgi:hypothetical protein